MKKTNDGFLQEHETEVKKMKEEFVKRKVKLKEENDEMVRYFCGFVRSLIHSGGQTFTLQCLHVFFRDRAKKHNLAEYLR